MIDKITAGIFIAEDFVLDRLNGLHVNHDENAACMTDPRDTVVAEPLSRAVREA